MKRARGFAVGQRREEGKSVGQVPQGSKGVQVEEKIGEGSYSIRQRLQAHLLDLGGERVDVLCAVGGDVRGVGEERGVVVGVDLELCAGYKLEG